MKCENCGADYKASALICPYCGTKNSTGQEWMNEEQRARKQKDQTKSFVTASMPLYIINRILNTIIGVAVVLFVILFVVLGIWYFIEEQMDQHSFKTASLEEAEAIYQSKDYVKLYDYLTEHNVWYYDEFDEYEKYRDMATLSTGLERIQGDIIWYYDSSVEEIETHFSYGAVRNVFENCQKFLSHSVYYYECECEENQPIVEEYEDMVRAFLMGELFLTEEEVKEISEVSYMTSEEQDEWLRRIYDRKGWEIREDD